MRVVNLTGPTKLEEEERRSIKEVFIIYLQLFCFGGSEIFLMQSRMTMDQLVKRSVEFIVVWFWSAETNTSP